MPLIRAASRLIVILCLGAPYPLGCLPRGLAVPPAAARQTQRRTHAAGKRPRSARPSSARVGKGSPLRRPDVIYYPTPTETVDEMLRLAKLKTGDVLYDLGSGDGRIPITASQRYGIRAVGIEIDPKLIAGAEERAREAGVADRVSFRNEDLFRADISEATVVTLYLSNVLNERLRPKLLRELRPGTRILSHDFHMGGWKAEQQVRVPWQRNLFRTIYLWRVPPRRRQTTAPVTRRRDRS